MAEKMIVVCNGAAPSNIMPSLIFASSGIALDYDVHMFFCPAGAQALVKGELEKIGTPKGMPNPVDLFNTILDQKGKVVFCELAIENKGIDPKTLRDKRIVVEKVPPFLMGASGAGMTFVFQSPSEFCDGCFVPVTPTADIDWHGAHVEMVDFPVSWTADPRRNIEKRLHDRHEVTDTAFKIERGTYGKNDWN